MAELNLSPDEWIGYSGCAREKAEYLFREKYGYEGELEVRVTAGAILIRPKSKGEKNGTGRGNKKGN